MRWTRVYPWLVAAALGACTGTGQVEYSGQVAVTSPDLVEVQPGVQVVADADQPLFFVDGGYYLYRDGYWLRSDRYDRGFVRINVVPDRLRTMGDVHAYVHYRRSHGNGNMEARQENLRNQQQREREREDAQRTRTQNERTREEQVRENEQRQQQQIREREQNERATEQQRQEEQRRENQQRKTDERRDRKDDKRDEH